MCTLGIAAWHSFCSLFAAPELGCSQIKLSVYMECLEGVCHESVTNRANQESWLVGEKTLTLSYWQEEVEGPWDARAES